MTPAAPGHWANRAACRGQQSVMLIPENLKTYSTYVKARIARAKLICHSCPVLTECREWALSDPDPAYTMVAAGMSPKDRNAARKMGRVIA